MDRISELESLPHLVTGSFETITGLIQTQIEASCSINSAAWKSRGAGGMHSSLEQLGSVRKEEEKDLDPACSLPVPKCTSQINHFSPERMCEVVERG